MTTAVLRPRDYQDECKLALQAGWAEGRNDMAAVLPTGAGKGHPLDTEVPTPDGLRLWGDLQVGDQVFSRHGQPIEITAIYDRGLLDTYRVTLKHGESVLVDGDHLWRVQRKGRHPKVVSTRWLMSQPMKDRDGYLWALPVTAPVQRRQVELPLHPYVVGSLIANGGLTHDGTVLTTPDSQVIDRVRQYVAVTQLGVYPGRSCPAYNLPGLVKVTADLGMRVHSRDKRIPRSYLEASIGQRIALLQGLMVADGSVRHGGRRSLSYSTTSPDLAEDLIELVTSLGGTCSISKQDRTESGKPIEYTACILLPLDLCAFDTERKIADSVPRRAFRPRSAIVSIEPAGRAHIRCVTVSAPDQLYLITRQHIVTHNTIVFSHLAKDFHEETGRQALVEVHTDELVTQAYQKMRAVAPKLRVGIVKAWRNDIKADVIIGSVQTMRNARRLAELQRQSIGLIITDECHHATAKTYRRIREGFPDARCCGVTATLVRGDGKGLGGVWSGGVVYRKSISWMIRHGLGEDGYTSMPVLPGYGYLLDVRGKRICVDDFDLSNVRRSGGDYQRDSLGAELSRSMAPEVVAQAYLEHAFDRSGVVFTPTVATAYEFAEAMQLVGIKAEVVHGDLGTEERRGVLRRLEAGVTQVVCNCMVLTEGFDCTRINAVVVARATRSAGLYQQMVGRGLRPFHDPTTGEHQRDCLLIDVVGASEEHGLASLVDLSADVTRRPRDGQSLAEAEDEEAALAEQGDDDGPVIPDYRYRGKTVAVDFDPLARASKLSWMSTTGGTWFLSAGDCYVFVLPSVQPGALAGTYDLVWTRKDRKAELTYDGVTGFWGFTSHTALPLDYAFAWGEEVAAELGGDPFALLSRKDKRWRSQPPSEAQRRLCDIRGIEVAPDATKGDLSTLLDTWTASQMIDPAVAYFASQRVSCDV